MKKKPTKRKNKKHRIDSNEYTNIIPQTIESVGNFINNVKNPWLVIAVLLIVCGGILIHELIGIRTKYDLQNELIKKETELRKEKSIIEKGGLSNLLVPIYP